MPVRYFPEASSASFLASCGYGLKILWVVTRYCLHRSGLKRSRRLESIRAPLQPAGPGDARDRPARDRRPRRSTSCPRCRRPRWPERS